MKVFLVTLLISSLTHADVVWRRQKPDQLQKDKIECMAKVERIGLENTSAGYEMRSKFFDDCMAGQGWKKVEVEEKE